MPPPGGHGRGRSGGSAIRHGGRRRGGATATFEVPISRRHQPAPFKARNSPRRRSGPGPSKGWLQSPPCQDHVEQTPVSCSSKLLGKLKESSTTTTSSSTPQALLRDTTEISASSGCCLSSSPGPTIWLHTHPDWYLEFYIRRSLSESFHTYPDVGGPFKSLQEAQNAIDCHLHDLQDKTMRKESLDLLSPMDRLIKWSLYWPDGKTRKYSEAFACENTRKRTVNLLQALVDKYNEDHKLLGVDAYELKDALPYQTLREGNIWYRHFNFTTKAKEAGGIDDLFFAEVIQGDEMVVSCFCMINSDANGRCYGCTNNGSVCMKHPNEADAYNAGHLDGYFLYENLKLDLSDDDERVMTEEERLRHIYKSLDDPQYLKKISTSRHATATFC